MIARNTELQKITLKMHKPFQSWSKANNMNKTIAILVLATIATLCVFGQFSSALALIIGILVGMTLKSATNSAKKFIKRKPEPKALFFRAQGMSDGPNRSGDLFTHDAQVDNGPNRNGDLFNADSQVDPDNGPW